MYYAVNLQCLQAFVILLLWGYIHFTYILSSEDCLLNVTKRPFPSDVILQVEVYSNNSELWNKRQKAIEQLYYKMYSRSCPVVNSDATPGLTREELVQKLCESNRFVNWTRTHYLCQFMLDVLYTSVEFLNAYDKASSNRGHAWQSGEVKHRNKSPLPNVCSVKDIFWNEREYLDDTRVPIELVGIPKKKRDEIKSAIFVRNYTLFEVFDYYGRLEVCSQL